MTTTIYPALKYRNARNAIDWLREAFGFETGMVSHGEGDRIAHAELFYGDGGIMIGSANNGSVWPVTSLAEGGKSAHGIYVVVDDIEAHYERARAAGATILYDLHDTEYGSREYGARDLEGYPWSFGTYRPERE